MKRSSGPRKPVFLPQSIHHQLKMYASAACGAGVSLLAVVQPAEYMLPIGASFACAIALTQAVEGKIVYTPANVVIRGSYYHNRFDLNNDGKTDIAFGQSCFWRLGEHGCGMDAKPAPGNGVEEGDKSSHGWAAALKAGSNIRHGKQFNQAATVIMANSAEIGGHHFQDGYWFYTQARYLGLAFQINGKTHYGWMRLKNSSPHGATLTGYAYETIPGKSIKAGQKKEGDNPANENFGPDASLTSPIPDIPNPATLGALALGAPGLSIWRREDSVASTFERN
jgi:hypothetical protein